MSGALAGCGDKLHEIIDELADPSGGHSPSTDPPSTDPPDDGTGESGSADAGVSSGPDESGTVDAGVSPGPVEPPVTGACDPGPVEPPTPAPEPVDAGSPLPDPPPPPPEPEPVDAGPPPVEPPPVEPPLPLAPSFAADVWPIFMTGCSPCHTSLRRGGHSVGSANLAVAFADATRLGPTLIDRLDGGGMPLGCTGNPGDEGCIAIDDLATVEAWIDGGMAP
jgi:hypothetical protein